MSYNNGPTVTVNGLALFLDAADRNSYIGSGTVWKDLSGSNTNATLVSGPVFDSANGGYISFDGTNDVATVLNTFPADQPITISAWVRKIGSTLAIVDTINDSINWDGFGMWIIGNTFRFYLLKQYPTPGPSIQMFLDAVTPILTDVWYNLCCVYTGTQGQVYINGRLDNSTNYSGGYDIGASNIGIGARQSGGSPSRCDIASVYIYNRALSQTEVLNNYNSIKSRF
jgi:hypothetical protein